MNYKFDDFKCSNPECDSNSFCYALCQYDGTHEDEDYEYSWANVPENLRNGIIVYQADGSCKPDGYRPPPNRWTTREQRNNDPQLIENIKNTRYVPLVCIYDYTWCRCSKCESEVDLEYAESFTKTIDWSKMAIREEIGIVVINDYAISRIEIE